MRWIFGAPQEQLSRRNRPRPFSFSRPALEILEDRITPTGNLQSLLGLTQLQTAFPTVNGASETVALLDTGINYNLPSLGGGVGPGYRVIYGYNFVNNTANALDDNGHGTFLASMIGSSSPSDLGIAPDVQFADLKVLDSNMNGSWTAIENALQWVIANKVQDNIVAVNMSFGSGNYSSDDFSVVESDLATLKSMGVFIAAASGNNYATNGSVPGLSYPAVDPDVVSVGATWAGSYGAQTFNGATDNTTVPHQLADFTQRDSALSILAPGAWITTIGMNGSETTLGGTSMATAVVTGAAVLLHQALDQAGEAALTTEPNLLQLMQTTGTSVTDKATSRDHQCPDHRPDVQGAQPASSAERRGPGHGAEPGRDPQSNDARWADDQRAAADHPCRHRSGHLQHAGRLSARAGVSAQAAVRPDLDGQLLHERRRLQREMAPWQQRRVLLADARRRAVPLHHLRVGHAPGCQPRRHAERLLLRQSGPALERSLRRQPAGRADGERHGVVHPVARLLGRHLRRGGHRHRCSTAVTASFNLTVNPAPPVLTPIANQTVTLANSNVSLTLSATDAELGPVSYNAQVLPANGQTPAVTLSLQGTHLTLSSPNFVGTYTVQISRQRSDGGHHRDLHGHRHRRHAADAGCDRHADGRNRANEPGGAVERRRRRSRPLDLPGRRRDAEDASLYQLNQQYGFQEYNGSYYLNLWGQNEKWLVGKNNVWYMLLPTGQLYRWAQSVAATLQPANLIATLSPAIYAEPRLLWNAQLPVTPALTFSFAGGALTIQRPAGLTGVFFIDVTVSDGFMTTKQTFELVLN